MRNRKAIFVVCSSIALNTFALFASTARAHACEPAGDQDTTCANVRIHLSAASTSTLSLPVVLAATATPRGDSPSTARDITDTWSSIDPRASIWFKTDNSDSYREIELWLDTPAQNGLGLSIFSPDQANSWWNSRPVGRGSYNPGMPGHALTWKVAYAEGGIWYALLQNYTDSPVPYRLSGNFTSTATKSCHGYWEYLPNGAYIYWVDCNPAHNP
jgi:hypothetical protein